MDEVNFNLVILSCKEAIFCKQHWFILYCNISNQEEQEKLQASLAEKEKEKEREKEKDDADSKVKKEEKDRGSSKERRRDRSRDRDRDRYYHKKMQLSESMVICHVTYFALFYTEAKGADRVIDIGIVIVRVVREDPSRGRRVKI